MWKLEDTDEFQRKLKKLVKRFGREWIAVADNFDTYQTCVEEGNHPLKKMHSFVHHEPLGIVAICSPKAMKALRLYVYPEVETKIFHVITVGDKSSQSDDIQYAKEFVESLRKLRQNEQAIQEHRGPNPPHFRFSGGVETTGATHRSTPIDKEANGPEIN